MQYLYAYPIMTVHAHIDITIVAVRYGHDGNKIVRTVSLIPTTSGVQ